MLTVTSATSFCRCNNPYCKGIHPMGWSPSTSDDEVAKLLRQYAGTVAGTGSGQTAQIPQMGLTRKSQLQEKPKLTQGEEMELRIILQKEYGVSGA